VSELMVEIFPMGSRPTFIHLHALRATPRSITPHTVRSYFGEFKQKKVEIVSPQ